MLAPLRQTFRSLARSPGFAAFAVLAIALGIAAGALLGSFTYALLVRALPIPDLDRVAFALPLRDGFDPYGTTYYDYAALSRNSRAAQSAGLARGAAYNLGDPADPQHLDGSEVANYFETLRLRPALGRLFSPGELAPGGPAVALLGHDLWQQRFAGRPDALGQTIALNGQSTTIVGIMPPGIDLPQNSALWTPLRQPADAATLGARDHYLVLRLRPGANFAALRDELRAHNTALQRTQPAFYKNFELTAIPLREQLYGDIFGRVRRTLFALAAGVGLLVLLAAVNVASLLLARNIARERELAIRQSLGATRGAIARQLLLESAVLALAGGVAGLLLAAWVAPLAARLSPVEATAFAAQFGAVTLNPAIVVIALAVALLVGLGFGVLPSLRASRSLELSPRLRAGGRGGSASPAALHALRLLVAGEVALAALLLVSGALLGRSFQNLSRLALGWEPASRFTTSFTLPDERYPTVAQRLQFIEQLLARTRALPGIAAADVTNNLPLDSIGRDVFFEVEGRAPAPGEQWVTSHRIVTPGYKDTLGLTLVAGRFLSERDRAGQLPVAVVTEEFARTAWPGRDPLGQRVRRALRPGLPANPWLTIVGVVKNTKEDRSNYRIDRPTWYLSYYQFANDAPFDLVLRTSGAPAGLSAALRTTVRSLDAQQPLSPVVPLSTKLDGLLVTERFATVLMGALSTVGLVLAAVGLFGVISYSVSQRLHDFGVRAALGATPAQLLRLVLGQGLVTAGLGLAAGLAGSLCAARLLASLLFEVHSFDLVAFAATLTLLLFVTLTACLLPALRALRADPTTVLRSE
jgi:putative ABC transport system permease protein